MSTETSTSDRPPITTRIVGVTVYPAQARIVRRGTATVSGTGEQTVTVTGLPENLDEDSVRASATGPAGLRMTGVEVGYGTAREDGRVPQLRAEVERLEDVWRELDDTDAVVGEEIEQIIRMRNSNAKRLADADALDQTETIARLLSERSTAARGRRREIGAQKRAATRELDAARAALAAAQGGGEERSTRQVVVGLDVAAGQGGEIEIEISVTYVVWGAFWQPLYDVRLVDDRVTLGYLASVQQTSGEDWPAVPLTLSTARPGANGILPDPEPWYVDVARPILAQRGMARPAAMPAVMPAAAADLAYGAAPAAMKSMVAAESDEAVVDETGAARVFRSARPVAIPSDGAPHRVPITSLDLPATVDHVCAPRSGSEVHVRATVINSSAVTLLPGTAAVFRDDELVGRTQLELIAPGEEIELHLGIEDRIDVERELVRRDARKAGLINSTGRIVLAYATTITSYLPGPARLVLIDQVPVAKDPVVSVKVAGVHPAATRTDQLGRYEWDLDLTPKTEVTVSLEFAVEGPRDKTLIGLGL